jgi:hypothetical protein
MTARSPATSQLVAHGHFKDAVLNELADQVNVAQFISYAADLSQRHCRVQAYPAGHRFRTLEEGLSALLAESGEGSVNVRSFDPVQPKSHEFIYGVRTVEDAAAAVRRLGAQGLLTIANETIDIHDGGVSGVAYGDALEFAPGDTPRAVEKPGIAAFPKSMGCAVLHLVYGFTPALDFPPDVRVEFSLHPLRRGHRREHTVIWETETLPGARFQPVPEWPNRFSRHIGDKAFGLLVAHVVGLAVPATTVIPRATAPFDLGRPTGTGETWIRTAPHEPQPGRFSTAHGWLDPFRLLREEDPSGSEISSVLAQEGVDAQFSGAVLSDGEGRAVIEGIAGGGEAFMLGRRPPERMPRRVTASVERVFKRASRVLGPVGFEWVFDGSQVWVVQLHRGPAPSAGRTIVPGDGTVDHHFFIEDGLDHLRALVELVKGTGGAIVIVGDVGLTSHVGDVLRKAKIPSRVEPASRGAL